MIISRHQALVLLHTWFRNFKLVTWVTVQVNFTLQPSVYRCCPLDDLHIPVPGLLNYARTNIRTDEIMHAERVCVHIKSAWLKSGKVYHYHDPPTSLSYARYSLLPIRIGRLNVQSRTTRVTNAVEYDLNYADIWQTKVTHTWLNLKESFANQDRSAT